MAVDPDNQRSILQKMRQHPSYAVLDEYIRWDQDRLGKQAALSFLEHLNHVFIYQKDGRGPSVFERVLNLLEDCQNGRRNFSWRLLNKDLGSSVTRVWASRLRCTMDSVCLSSMAHIAEATTQHKFRRFLNGLKYCPRSGEEWQLGRHGIREITFCQDHPFESLLPGPRDQQLCEYDDLVMSEFWDTFLARIIPRLPNLESFRWHTTAPVSSLVLERLTRPGYSPKLRNTELVINDQPQYYEISQPLVKINGGRLGGPADFEENIAIAARTLPDDCKLVVYLVRGDDNNLRSTLEWLGSWTNQIEYLKIDQTDSSEGSKASLTDGLQLEPLPRPLFTVRGLGVTEMGSSLACLVSAINPFELTSISVERCTKIRDLLGMARQSKNLKHLAYTAFPITDIEDFQSVAEFRRAMKAVVDCLEGTKSKLSSLYIRGGFPEPNCPGYHADGRELRKILKSVGSSLRSLDIVNSSFDLSTNDLRRVAKYAPNLSELSITCALHRMSQDGVVTTGLGHKFQDVLEVFGSKHVPFIIKICPVIDNEWEQELNHSQLPYLLFCAGLAFRKTPALKAINIPSSSSLQRRSHTIHPSQDLTFIPSPDGKPHFIATQTTHSINPLITWFPTTPLLPSSITLPPATPAETLRPAFSRHRPRPPCIPARVSHPSFSAALGPPGTTPIPTPLPPAPTDHPQAPAPSLLAATTHSLALRTAPTHARLHAEAALFAPGAIRTDAAFPLAISNARKRRFYDADLVAHGRVVDVDAATRRQRAWAGRTWMPGFDGRLLAGKASGTKRW